MTMGHMLMFSFLILSLPFFSYHQKFANKKEILMNYFLLPRNIKLKVVLLFSWRLYSDREDNSYPINCIKSHLAIK